MIGFIAGFCLGVMGKRVMPRVETVVMEAENIILKAHIRAIKKERRRRRSLIKR